MVEEEERRKWTIDCRTILRWEERESTSNLQWAERERGVTNVSLVDGQKIRFLSLEFVRLFELNSNVLNRIEEDRKAFCRQTIEIRADQTATNIGDLFETNRSIAEQYHQSDSATLRKRRKSAEETNGKIRIDWWCDGRTVEDEFSSRWTRSDRCGSWESTAIRTCSHSIRRHCRAHPNETNARKSKDKSMTVRVSLVNRSRKYNRWKRKVTSLLRCPSWMCWNCSSAWSFRLRKEFFEPVENEFLALENEEKMYDQENDLRRIFLLSQRIFANTLIDFLRHFLVDPIEDRLGHRVFRWSLQRDKPFGQHPLVNQMGKSATRLSADTLRQKKFRRETRRRGDRRRGW